MHFVDSKNANVGRAKHDENTVYNAWRRRGLWGSGERGEMCWFTIFLGLESMTTGPTGGCEACRRAMTSDLVSLFNSMTLIPSRRSVAFISSAIATVGTMKMPIPPQPYVQNRRRAAMKITVLPAPQGSCAQTSLRSSTRARISLN